MLRNQIAEFDRLIHHDIDWGEAMTKKDKKIYDDMHNTAVNVLICNDVINVRTWYDMMIDHCIVPVNA